MAEREGFEPPVPVKVQWFSRPPVSTAHTPLRVSVVNSLPVLDAHRSKNVRLIQVQTSHQIGAGAPDGLLSGVVKGRSALFLRNACDGTPLACSQLLVTEVPVEVFCPDCQAPLKLTSTQWFCSRMSVDLRLAATV